MTRRPAEQVIHHDHDEHHGHSETKPKDEYGLFTLYDHELYDITHEFPEGFHAKPNVVFLFSVNEHTEFII